MKKGFLKALCLAGIFAFTISVVGYCDNVGYKKASIVLENETKNDELYSAVIEGNLEKAKELIESGANVNFIKKYASYLGQDESILVCAINRNDLEMIKLLIENGVDINLETELIPNEDDSMCFIKPINAACYCGRNEVIKILLENNIDINDCDSYGVSPLYYACYGIGGEGSFHKCGNIETVKLLIENGAHINGNNRSILLEACIVNDLELAKLLIENGADVNSKDMYGDTPLHGATEYGNYEIVKLLIENGANVNASDNLGRSPLDNAIVGFHIREYLQNSDNIGDFIFSPDYNDGHAKIIKLLKHNGAKANKDKVIERCELAFDTFIVESYEEQIGLREKIDIWT